MQCPSCQNTDSRVLESRAADSGRSVRRRRECLNCDFRFTTYERVETVPISVIKKNGSKEIFNRETIYISTIDFNSNKLSDSKGNRLCIILFKYNAILGSSCLVFKNRSICIFNKK